MSTSFKKRPWLSSNLKLRNRNLKRAHTIVDSNDAQACFDLANTQETAAQAELIVRRGILEQIDGHPVSSLKPLTKDAKCIPVADSVNPKLHRPVNN